MPENLHQNLNWRDYDNNFVSNLFGIFLCKSLLIGLKIIFCLKKLTQKEDFQKLHHLIVFSMVTIIQLKLWKTHSNFVTLYKQLIYQIMQLLISIDQFGVESSLQTYAKKSQAKSAFGGIMTLILYGASLGYFLYEFVDWAKNNKLPKITSLQNQIEQGELINLKGRFLEITSSQWKENLTDPFDPDALILYPITIYINQNILIRPLNNQLKYITIMKCSIFRNPQNQNCLRKLYIIIDILSFIGVVVVYGYRNLIATRVEIQE